MSVLKEGDDAARQLLVMHKLSGCDTPSAVHGCGKATAFKKLLDVSHSHLCDVVTNGTDKNAIAAAGCQLVVALCGGKVAEQNAIHMEVVFLQ